LAVTRSGTLTAGPDDAHCLQRREPVLPKLSPGDK
jgi:hypothetical protein